MYLVVGRKSAALIDTGMGIGNVCEKIRKITPLPIISLNTHCHWDHTGANALFDEIALNAVEFEMYAQEPDMSVYRNAMQIPNVRAALPVDFDPGSYRIIRKPITRTLRDGDTIELGSRTLTAIHTPGHSPGHTAFFDETSGVLFTGDAAYCGPMYACFAGSDPRAFASSARRLSQLRGAKTICPGHEEIMPNANWLAELADAMEVALSGKAIVGTVNEEMKQKELPFSSFSVWFPLEWR